MNRSEPPARVIEQGVNNGSYAGEVYEHFDSGLSQHDKDVLNNAIPIKTEKEDTLKSEFRISRAQRLFFEV